jgi:EF-P beta-lysylation protein EpmB
VPEPQPVIPASRSWQDQLRNVVTSVAELRAILGLGDDDPTGDNHNAAGFPVKVPRDFVRRMRSGDPRDPLLLQVLATPAENAIVPGFHRDPVGETGAANPQPGIIHKYRGRALLITSSGCAINCRYCFRRHFPYDDNRNSRREWRAALRYIAADSDIGEVILSGGDPLLLTDPALRELCTDIAAIAHVKRLRIHTRLPVVIPDRVTESLLEAIIPAGVQTLVVLHCNHANEIDDSVSAAVAMMKARGIMVLNQAVLLAGVNDSVPAQVDLSEALFAAGVLPYYLHLLDKVQGAAHFDVPEAQALTIMRELAAGLPGYLVPKLVREVAGETAKVPVQVA